MIARWVGLSLSVLAVKIAKNNNHSLGFALLARKSQPSRPTSVRKPRVGPFLASLPRYYLFRLSWLVASVMCVCATSQITDMLG